MADRVVTAHIPALLAREVDRIAERLERPRGWVVKEALTRYVELEQKRHELTQEALDDVDAGRVSSMPTSKPGPRASPGRPASLDLVADGAPVVEQREP